MRSSCYSSPAVLTEGVALSLFDARSFYSEVPLPVRGPHRSLGEQQKGTICRSQASLSRISLLKISPSIEHGALTSHRLRWLSLGAHVRDTAARDWCEPPNLSRPTIVSRRLSPLQTDVGRDRTQ